MNAFKIQNKRVSRLYKNTKRIILILLSVVVKSQWRTRPGCCNASVFCGLCRVCGCRVRRARAIRITRLRSRASEREKKRSGLAFLLHRNNYRRRYNRRCAVVAVRSSWWCAAELYGLRVATLSVPDRERLSVHKVAGPPRFVRVPYQLCTTREKLFFTVYSL